MNVPAGEATRSTPPSHTAGQDVRLVYPHQLFAEHLTAPAGTLFVLVENDLFFRQYPFHVQKLVLHRASMRRFARTLAKHGFEVHAIESSADETTHDRLADLLRSQQPASVSLFDPVDDWLMRDTRAAIHRAGLPADALEVLESPNFLTTGADLDAWFAAHPPRMHLFYQWQRRRLDILMDGRGPAGGHWSFDPSNRRRLPRKHPVPDPWRPDETHPEVAAAIAWVRREFPDNPGRLDAFTWPTSHAEAEASFTDFLERRFAEFGPYEDAMAADHRVLFHAQLSAGLNAGLISPHTVVQRALAMGGSVPIESLEGFIRQVIGWREYMRGSYRGAGRRMRMANRLHQDAPLAEGWWTAGTGLLPVDHALRGVLDSAYAHHIERLMVFGNAMCLLRVNPHAVYEWFMAMFIDAYDWVMVPNVYAMSQFAAGDAITTKPYVSGSNYLKKMGQFPSGEWTADWDALYWTFVADHRDLLDANSRSGMVVRLLDGFDEATRRGHAERAQRWLADGVAD